MVMLGTSMRCVARSSVNGFAVAICAIFKSESGCAAAFTLIPCIAALTGRKANTCDSLPLVFVFAHDALIGESLIVFAVALSPLPSLPDSTRNSAISIDPSPTPAAVKSVPAATL